MSQAWQNYIVAPTELADQDFDVVIVGSGMGGGMAALNLCRAGIRVLLVEKGRSFLEQSKLTGVEVEHQGIESRLLQGRWPVKLSSKVEGVASNFYAPLGCGLGGSTLIYGGAVERFSPEDFEPRQMPSGELVEWPYTYGEIEPYYQQAESLLNVHGTVDPLESGTNYQLKVPPPLNATDRYFESLFRKSGLNPYHLHVAIGDADNTRNRDNVKGALESGIIPALETGNLLIVSDCEVERLIADASQVQSVELKSGDQNVSLSITGKNIILACGAYFTPALLLKSSNDIWPQGLANTNGLVGCYLMMHTSDYLGVWSTKRHSDQGADKTLGLRDFYSVEGEKLGQLQSTGKSAQMGYILYFLRQKLQRSPFGKIPLLSQVIRQLLRIPAFVACILFREVSIFSSIVEDFPYSENRILLDSRTDSGILLQYNIKEELKNRTRKFRRLIGKSIKNHWVVNFTHGVDLNFGHPCGTCRSGSNPESSVVNEQGKAHALKNLYIADASFMPTSGGTNPSLTIAAHALRVADLLARKIKENR